MAGYELQVGDQDNKKARILVDKKGTKSIIGREWLSTLRYPFTPENKDEWEVNSVESNEKLSAEVTQLSSELFERNGLKNHRVKIILEHEFQFNYNKRY